MLVHGNIRSDGKIHDAVAVSSSDPNLDAEALQLDLDLEVLALMCNNRPASLSTDFVLDFQGSWNAYCCLG